MKKIFILTLSIYQKIISPALLQLLGIKNACRFDLTCSEYAKIQIQKHGVIRGSFYSAQRISKCQPFYNKA